MAPDLLESKVIEDGVLVRLGKPKGKRSKRVRTFPCCIFTVALFFSKCKSHMPSTKSTVLSYENISGSRVACFTTSI
jgi:hypothetical protein